MPKTWEDLSKAAWERQLADRAYWDNWAYGHSPKRKTAPKDGLSNQEQGKERDNPQSSRKGSLA